MTPRHLLHSMNQTNATIKGGANLANPFKSYNSKLWWIPINQSIWQRCDSLWWWRCGELSISFVHKLHKDVIIQYSFSIVMLLCRQCFTHVQYLLLFTVLWNLNKSNYLLTEEILFICYSGMLGPNNFETTKQSA